MHGISLGLLGGRLALKQNEIVGVIGPERIALALLLGSSDDEGKKDENND